MSHLNWWNLDEMLRGVVLGGHKCSSAWICTKRQLAFTFGFLMSCNAQASIFLAGNCICHTLLARCGFTSQEFTRQYGMTKTDIAVQTLSDVNSDVILELWTDETSCYNTF